MPGPILSRLLNRDEEESLEESPLLRDERPIQQELQRRMKQNGSGCCGATVSAQEMREMIKDADNR
jgi:hypothetical protein